jgi:hypothetical protein
MGQALDQALYRLLGSVLVAGNSIANLHDGTPVLGREVLIGSLVCEVKLLVSAAPQTARHVLRGELTDGLIVGPGRGRSEHGDGWLVQVFALRL